MKAVVISGVGQIEVADVPDPTPGPRDVVIEVAACGICGTDMHILEGEFAPSLPITPGHEFSGTVVAVGADVTELRIGHAVTVDPSLHCGECYYCRQGRGNLCENWGAIGVTTSGGAAQYALAPARNCVRLPEGSDVANAALVEPLSCAVRGYDVLPRRLGDKVLVYGAGTMGLMMTALARRAGAVRVDVTDPNADRLATASLLDVDHAVTSADQLDAPRGWDVVIDCTGVPAAIEDGLQRVSPGGTFLQFGVSGESDVVPLQPFRIYNKEVTVTGSMAVLHSFERASDLFLAGALDPALFITHRFALDDYASAIEVFRAGTGRKIQVGTSFASTR